MNGMWDKRWQGHQRSKALLMAGALLLCIVLGIPGQASAAVLKLTQRSVNIHTSHRSAVTPYDFTFTYSASTPVGSMRFLFCDSPLDTDVCTPPVGLNVAAVTLSAQSGSTGFGVDSRTANEILISRAPTVNATGDAAYQFSNATNPSVAGSFYVRIFAYPTQDATGPENAFGAVAGAVLQRDGIVIDSEVPPILVFCVGITIPGGCDTAQDYFVELGTLTPARASAGTSQMLAATNANYGLSITMQGSTMTSGNDTIPALSRPASSAPGRSQFGVNLRDNQDPNVGANPSGAGTTNPTADYNQPNAYMFNSGDLLAASTGTTDYRKFTVSYMANVAAGQPAGVYNTTVTYVCTGTF